MIICGKTSLFQCSACAVRVREREREKRMGMRVFMENHKIRKGHIFILL